MTARKLGAQIHDIASQFKAHKSHLMTSVIVALGQNDSHPFDYMKQDDFLNPQGEVRSISLAEIGYTSSFGNEQQEASIVYGYLKAQSILPSLVI